MPRLGTTEDLIEVISGKIARVLATKDAPPVDDIVLMIRGALDIPSKHVTLPYELVVRLGEVALLMAYMMDGRGKKFEDGVAKSNLEKDICKYLMEECGLDFEPKTPKSNPSNN